MFFIKKYLKSPIALLVCLALILQLLPSPQPAQAGFWDIVKKIISRIDLPQEVELTDAGEIKMSGASKDILTIGPITTNEIFDWLFDDLVPEDVRKQGEDKIEEWWDEHRDDSEIKTARKINPFSKVSLSGDSREQTFDEKGKPIIPIPIIPEECELRIKRPGDVLSDLPEEESLAHRAACSYFIRLQKAAAEQIYLAKRIFNSTNPYDDCFFLANCRSKCYLSYGELKYIITWLDIAQFLLPTAWVTVVKKIMGVLAALQEIKKAYDTLKGLLADGFDLVNNFLATFNYLVNMFEALKNVGNTMSASIGLAGVMGSALAEAGVLKISDNALKYGQVAAAGATVLTASKGISGLGDMLKRFSDNLLSYSSAKSETNNYILGIRRDLTAILEGDSAVSLKGAKHEPELSFFFEPNNPARKNLDQIVNDFQRSFKTLASLVDNAVGPGLLPGELVIEMLPAPPFGNEGDYYTIPEQERPLPSGIGAGSQSNIPLPGTNFEGTVMIIDEKDNGINEQYEKKDFCSGRTIGGYSDAKTNICWFQDDQIIPWQAKCPDDPDLTLSGDREELRQLTEPEKVKEVLSYALDGYDINDNYKSDRLRENEEWKRRWVEYWVALGDLTVPDSGILKCIKKTISKQESEEDYPSYKLPKDANCDISNLQFEILSIKAIGLPESEPPEYEYKRFLEPLGILDDRNGEGGHFGGGNYHSEGARSQTENYININYAPKHAEYFGDVCAPGRVEGENTWLYNFKQIFEHSFNLQTNFKLLDPLYLEEILIGEGSSIMACATQSGKCKLDGDVQEWRDYWEKLALAQDSIGPDEVAKIKRDTKPGDDYKKKVHQQVVGECLKMTDGDNSLLGYLVSIEFGHRFDFDVEHDNGDERHYHYDFSNTLFNGKKFAGIKNRDHDYLNDYAGNDCQSENDLEEMATKKFIGCLINEYATGRANGGDVSNGYAVEVTASISKILRYINDLHFQKKYLEDPVQHLPTVPKKERHLPKGSDLYGGNDYWKSKFWCADSCQTDPGSRFEGTYDPLIANYDWPSRVRAMVDSYDDLTFLADALSAGLTPQTPVIVYQISKNSDGLVKAVQQASDGVDYVSKKRNQECELYKYYYDGSRTEKLSRDCTKDGCPCDKRACLEWTAPLPDEYVCVASQAVECVEEICACCSDKDDCQTKRDNKKAEVNPKCPETDTADEGKEKSILAGLFGDWEYYFGSEEGESYKKFEEIKSNLLALQNVWQDNSMDNPDSSANFAKSYAASIIESKKLAQDISDQIFDLKISFDAAKTPAEMRDQITVNLDYLPESQKNELLTIVNTFEPYYKQVKEEVLEPLDAAIGEYAYPAEASVCPADVQKMGFLNRISCFEWNISTTGPIEPIKEGEDWISPTGFIDYANPEADWVNETNIYDNNLDTYSYVTNTGGWPVELSLNSPIHVSKVRVYTIDKSDLDIRVDVFYEDGGSDFFQLRNQINVWQGISLSGTKLVKRARIYSWDPALHVAEFHFFGRTSVPGGGNARVFEDLIAPLSAIENVEKSLFLLNEAEQETDKVSSIQESVRNLKPEIRSEALQLNKEVIDDFGKKLSGGAKKIFNKYNPFAKSTTETGVDGIDENATDDNINKEIFNSVPDGEIDSFKDFVSELTDNPLRFLDEQFNNINKTSKTIKSKLSDAETWLAAFFNDDRKTLYETALDKVKETKMTGLNLLVFGNNEIKPACEALGILLRGDLTEMDKTCSQKAAGGERDDDFLATYDNDDMNKKCEAWLNLPGDVVSEEEAKTKIEELEKQRNCVGTYCLKCPTWMCQGAGDPKCMGVSKCPTTNNKKIFGEYKTVCRQGAAAVFAVNVFTPETRKWPPTKPPLLNGYTIGYQGAKTTCIQTQEQLSILRESVAATTSPETLELVALTDTCHELTRQKKLKRECERYTLTKCAAQDKCGSAGCDIEICETYKCENKTTCSGLRTNMNSICSVGTPKPDDKYCNGNSIKDITESDNAAGMKKLRQICIESQNIRTPLDEIMRVLSVLMGIQSGTAAHGGIVSSIKGSQIFYNNAGKFIKMIQGLGASMKTAYDSTVAMNAASSGGLKITPFKCVAGPMESYPTARAKVIVNPSGGQKPIYSGNKAKAVTGPNGGQVCPDVAGLYGRLQAQFSQIRQEVHNIEKVYRKAKDTTISLPWGENAYFHLFTDYTQTYNSIKPMFERAKELKQSSQFVWALATALNFASENCVCGMSYCKLPFCISGLPLTLSPLKDPYCALVWMLRNPLVNMAKRLEEDLNLPLQTD